MTRIVYGQDTQWPTWNATTRSFAPFATVSFWTTSAMSTQITDLLNGVGGAESSVTSLVDGSMPQFSGPNSGQGSGASPGMWAFAGGAEVVWYNPQQLSGSVSGVVLAANNGTDFLDAGTVRWNLHFPALDAKVVAIGAQSLTGKPSIDGYTTTNGDRVLLTAQSTASQNGIWQLPASGSGAWARPTDFPAAGVIATMKTCDIATGGTYAGTHWDLETATPVTIDTTAQVWSSEAALVQSLSPIAFSGALSDATGTGSLGQLPTGAIFTVTWDGTTLKNAAGTTITARPSTRTDLTMFIKGGPAATPPAIFTPGAGDMYFPTS